MAYENPLMVEFNVPRSPEVGRRIHGFYQEIGWSTRDATTTEFDTYVNPQIDADPLPVILYYQTQNQDKTGDFVMSLDPEPTRFSSGWALPKLQQLVEVTLVVPTGDDVHDIFEQGGKTLRKHTHVLPRNHEGSEEFRYKDPFNYLVRVATPNPRWEFVPPPYVRPVVISHVSKADFENTIWKRGAGLSFGALKKVLNADLNSPMRVIDGDMLEGDLAATIDWINGRKLAGTPNFLRILEAIQADREAQKE